MRVSREEIISYGNLMAYEAINQEISKAIKIPTGARSYVSYNRKGQRAAGAFPGDGPGPAAGRYPGDYGIPAGAYPGDRARPGFGLPLEEKVKGEGRRKRADDFARRHKYSIIGAAAGVPVGGAANIAIRRKRKRAQQNDEMF